VDKCVKELYDSTHTASPIPELLRFGFNLWSLLVKDLNLYPHCYDLGTAYLNVLFISLTVPQELAVLTVPQELAVIHLNCPSYKGVSDQLDNRHSQQQAAMAWISRQSYDASTRTASPIPELLRLGLMLWSPMVQDLPPSIQ